MFRLLKLKLVQQELRDRWDAGDRVGLVVRPARCPRRTRVGKLSIRNLYDLEDSNGVKIMQQILAAAAEGGGYVEYLWDDPKVAGDEETGSPKVGYAVPYTALGEEFILGSGFYPGSASTAVAGRSWGRLKVGFVSFSGRSDPP